MNRIYYDTEFIEDGSTIDLISIGMVTDDGRQYYAVNADMPVDRIKNHDWLMDNVWPHLPLRGEKSGLVTVGRRIERKLTTAGHLDTRNTLVRPRWVIANEVRDLIQTTEDPELWAWYGAYDHVVLAQLWGPMVRLPDGVPMWTNDLQQEIHRLGYPDVPDQAEGEHRALDDALHVRTVLRELGRADR